MKIELKYLFVLIIFTFISYQPTVAEKWINFTNGENIRVLKHVGDNIWIGSTAGICILNKLSGEKIFLNKANSKLPSNIITAFELDNSGTLWIGTDNGLCSVNGTIWTIYNSTNTILSNNRVTSIAIDSNQNIFIGIYNSGFYKFDRTNWKLFNTSNSKLINDNVVSICVDKRNRVWIASSTIYGEGNAIDRLDGNNWWRTYYAKRLNKLITDKNDNIWVGASATDVGEWAPLARYSDSVKTIWGRDNSTLSQDEILSLDKDTNNLIWLGISDFGLVLS